MPSSGNSSTLTKADTAGTKRFGRPDSFKPATRSGIFDSSIVCSTTSCSPFFSDGTPVTANTCSIAPWSSWSLASIAPCGDHLAADLREAREPVGDRQVAVVVDPGDVAGRVPTILQHLGGQLVAAEVAAHDVRPGDLEEALFAGAERLAAVEVDDAQRHSGQRLADGAAARTGLVDARRTEPRRIDGDDRGALGRAVAFERADTEALFEGRRDAIGKLLRAHDDEAQGTELTRATAANVDLQKGRRRDQQAQPVLLHPLADRRRIEGVRAEHGRETITQREPQRERAKRVEQRQRAEHGVAGTDRQGLGQRPWRSS